MNNLNIGDVVQLNAGGPFMTVCDVEVREKISCRYFNEKAGTFSIQSFYVVELTVKKKAA